MCPQTQKVINIPTIWASIQKKKKKKERDTFVAQGRNRTSSD